MRPQVVQASLLPYHAPAGGPYHAAQMHPARQGLVGNMHPLPPGFPGSDLGTGKPLPAPLLERLSVVLKKDFSDVRFHVSPAASAINAAAYTSGSTIVFAPGWFQPETVQGIKLIAHELVHVVQQREGRVRPLQGNASMLLTDPILEGEADRLSTVAVHQLQTAAPSMLGHVAQQQPAYPIQRLAPTKPGVLVPTSRPPLAPLEKMGHVTVQGKLFSGFKMTVHRPGPTPGPAGVIQRNVENRTVRSEELDEIKIIDEFFNGYEAAAKEAYSFVLQVPTLEGAYNADNGHLKRWREAFLDYAGGGRPSLLAAKFGYVIEALVTSGRFKPNPPTGYTVLPQVTRGGTRPDLVLMKVGGSTDLAWADLTAAGSVDHILTKDGWSQKVSNYAEITYPSLTLKDLAFMKANKDKVGPLDQLAYSAKLKEENEKYNEMRQNWVKFGKNFTVQNVKQALAEDPEIKFNNTLFNLRLELKRSAIIYYFKKKTGKDVTEVMMPSVLVALEVPSTSWGFNTGFSSSKAAGEAWLIDNLP